MHDVLPKSPLNAKAEAAPTAGIVSALLTELGELLGRFLDTGEHGTIDLLKLPMSPADLQYLKHRLGRGEVSIAINAAGNSDIYETGFAGLWWVEHADESGRVIARLIEVADVPSMVPSHRTDLAATAQTLTGRPWTGKDA